MDNFTVVAWPDEFVIVDNDDDWVIYTTTDTEYTLVFQAVGLNDAALAVAAKDAAEAAQAAAEAAAVSGMPKAIYDPTNISADVFARANHTGTQSADTLTDGATNKAFLATERTKLAGVATGATANSTDAQLRDRSTHTGTQSADTLTDGVTNKAFLATERTKLAGIATGATANATDAQLRDRSTHTGTQLAATISDFSAAADTRADARIAASLGVTVQPLDSDLTAIAALATTAYGRGLLTLAANEDLRNAIDAPVYVATRAVMKALDTTKDVLCFLQEPGREGFWRWSPADYSALITADTVECVTVKANAIASNLGAWTRIYEGGLVAEWGGLDNTGTTDITASLVVMIAVAKLVGAGSIRFAEKKYRVTTGNIVLDNIKLIGAGVPNVQPSSGPPYVYVDGNTTFIISSANVNPVFLLGIGWAVEGISFWWEGQVGPAVVTTFGALFSTAGQTRSTRGNVSNCTIFNAYRVFNVDTNGVFGDVVFNNNRVCFLEIFSRIGGYMPEYFRVVNNFFSPGVIESLLSAQNALKTQVNTAAILFHIANGAGTSGQSVDGLFFEDNFVFGFGGFMVETSGALNVSRICNNKFDGVPQLLLWNGTGINSASLWAGNLIYAYEVALAGGVNAAQNKTVFSLTGGAGNAASEVSFIDNKISYAQGSVFLLGATAEKYVVSNNEVVNWAMTSTAGNYAVLTSGASMSHDIIGNSFAQKDNPPAGANAYGMQLSGNCSVLSNSFYTVNYSIVVNAGTTKAKGNTSEASPQSDTTVVGGTLIGFNEDNAWSNPTPAHYKKQIVTVQGAPVALSNSSTAVQNLFAAANDTLNLLAGTTYRFSGVISLNTGATTHTTSFGFAGSVTLTAINYVVEVTSSAAGTPATPQKRRISTAGVGVCSATSVAVQTDIEVEGIIRVNAAGTLIPQTQFNAGPTGTCEVAVGSFLEFENIGNNTFAAIGDFV